MSLKSATSARAAFEVTTLRISIDMLAYDYYYYHECYGLVYCFAFYFLHFMKLPFAFSCFNLSVYS